MELAGEQGIWADVLAVWVGELGRFSPEHGFLHFSGIEQLRTVDEACVQEVLGSNVTSFYHEALEVILLSELGEDFL